MLPQSKFKYYILLHVVVFVYGFTGIFGGLITLSAVKLVWLRIIIAAVVIFIGAFFSKKSLKINSKNLIKFMGAGCVIALHWITFYWAIKESNISITVICLSSATFFAALLEPIFRKRKLLLYELIFGIFVIIGLAYIFNFQPQHVNGIIIGIISAFLSALFTVINVGIAQDNEPFLVSVYEMLGGIVLITIYLLFTSQINNWVFNVPFLDWLYLILLATICTAFAFVASVKVLKQVSAFTFTLSINLEPIYTIILAFFIFGEKEQMNVEFYVGTIFIVIILFLNAYIKSRQNTVQIKQM